ncbi:MAG: hypothetical protein ACYTAN_16445 [Planctomycetota bacterium]|jgi:predicted outer membrane lipoprotein
MSRTVSACVSFVFVFAVVFLLSGLLIMPFVPPYPDRPVTIFEGAYWYDNWPGLLLGCALGVLAAWRTLKFEDRKRRGAGAEGDELEKP